jgi:hypothetical protein
MIKQPYIVWIVELELAGPMVGSRVAWRHLFRVLSADASVVHQAGR